MTGRRGVVPTLASWILACAGAALLAAQTPTPPPPQEQRPPVFQSEANFVRVDVYPMAGDKPVLDLRAEEFEVLEDNVPQAVQTFEHVVVRPAGPQDLRAEPNSIDRSMQQAANPRNRVFVLFLDQQFVSISGSWNIRQPIIRLIDQILGPDDLIGIMTPRMAASDIVLARKTQVMQGGLMNLWPWGERFTVERDDREWNYQACFPHGWQAGIVREMVNRRRERLTMESLNELVGYLRNIREERKAILTVSEGWLLYRRNNALTTLLKDPVTQAYEPMPGGATGIGTGPDGRIAINPSQNNNTGATLNDCWEDRQRLAMLDNYQYMRDIIGEANRGNSSFYTVDPRGLAVFDTPMGPDPPPSVAVDFAMLRERQENLRTLADGTDGIAVMHSNDLDRSLKRMADDLTSDHLLGYYSTNTKFDGQLRTIKVRVKRPGVTVRARRGYRAATEAEIASGRKAAAAPVPELVGAMAASMGVLDRVRPGVRFYVNAVPAVASGTAVSSVWVAGELQTSGPDDPWLKGGSAAVEVRGQGATETAKVVLAPGERSFLVSVRLPSPAVAGPLEVRVRMTGTDPGAERSADAITIDPAAGPGRPLLFRRGPSTGNRLLPVATFHFSRSERARVEVPLGADGKPGTARLVDKAGQPLATPVTVGERTDAATGQRWMTADVTLASLGPGDYAVEVSTITPAGERRVVSAIRVQR